MHGILLAGGTGTRLSPLTKVTNKHLLPVYNKPMICYPIMTLVKSGVKNITIVLGGESIGDVVKLVGDGSQFGCKISYVHQKQAGGIAEAVNLALPLVKDNYVAVILGDNIFEDSFKAEIRASEKYKISCTLFLKELEHPERFGVPIFINEAKIVISYIEEKPEVPSSKYAVTGLYLYNVEILKSVIERVVKEKGYSSRGELEITDVNNEFLMRYCNFSHVVKGFWSDAGTFESLLKSTCFMAKKNESLPD